MDWSNSKKTIVKRNWTRVGGHISSGKTIYKAVSGPSDSLCASFRVVVLACCSPACHTQGLTQRKKKWAVGDWRKVVTRFLWPYHGTNRLFFFYCCPQRWYGPFRGIFENATKPKYNFFWLLFGRKDGTRSTRERDLKFCKPHSESQSFNNSILVSVG